RRYTDTTEIFDPAAGSFRPGPRLPVAVDGAAAATLADGSALVVGGQSSPSVATATAVLISPAGTVIVVGSMRHARFKHAAVTLTDGRMLVLGGTPDDVTLLASTEIYDPSTQEFTDGPVMRTGRYKLAGGVALTSAGEVIIAGGGSGAEVLNIAAGTTRPLDTVPVVRLSFSTVSVLGRSVRVLGGYDEAIRLTGTDVTVQLT
ncbi:MAG: kelch repeat-containing protein, partial [Nakamurella sp.]